MQHKTHAASATLARSSLLRFYNCRAGEFTGRAHRPAGADSPRAGENCTCLRGGSSRGSSVLCVCLKCARKPRRKRLFACSAATDTRIHFCSTWNTRPLCHNVVSSYHDMMMPREMTRYVCINWIQRPANRTRGPFAGIFYNCAFHGFNGAPCILHDLQASGVTLRRNISRSGDMIECAANCT